MLTNVFFRSCLLLSLGLVACGGGSNQTFIVFDSVASTEESSDSQSVDTKSEPVFITASVVFGDEGTTSVVSVLNSVDRQDIDYDNAREFPGWTDAWVYGEYVFLADGEAPTVTRYSVDEDRTLVEEGSISFLNSGAGTAAFWNNLIVSPTKAYLFVIAEREIVVWDPSQMEITKTISLPGLDDREGQPLDDSAMDRSAIVRGSRAYIPLIWGDYDEFSFSDDSAILVIDTQTDEVLEILKVDCPTIDVVTIDEDDNLYFSNWVFAVPPTLINDKPEACAVRIAAGSETIDESWSLTFSDTTDGRQAAALRFLGNDQALMSVFHDERVEVNVETHPNELLGSENWKLWSLDLSSKEAAPLDLDWNSGGYYLTRVAGRNQLFLPSTDYSSTTAYELNSNGQVTQLWSALGWTTRLFQLR